jgi:hypothetical protein
MLAMLFGCPISDLSAAGVDAFIRRLHCDQADHRFCTECIRRRPLEATRAQIQGAIDALVKRAIKNGDMRRDQNSKDHVRMTSGSDVCKKLPRFAPRKSVSLGSISKIALVYWVRRSIPGIDIGLRLRRLCRGGSAGRGAQSVPGLVEGAKDTNFSLDRAGIGSAVNRPGIGKHALTDRAEHVVVQHCGQVLLNHLHSGVIDGSAAGLC